MIIIFLVVIPDKMCKISIIIPLYNAEASLKSSLQSVRGQTLEDIEIICIDDGSNDNSADIIKKEQIKDSRIRYEYQNNQGAGVARNRGISISKGQYIAFMDADDRYPDIYALQRLYSAAIKHEALVCGGSAYAPDVNMKNDNDEGRVFKLEGFIRFSEYQFDFLFTRFIFKRSFIIEKKILFPILRVYEDPLFLIKALTLAKQFYAIKEMVYQYNGSHQVNEMSLEKVEDYLRGITEALKLSRKYHLKDLHKLTWMRLEKEACYYAEKYLYTGDKKIFSLLLQANNAIDRKLIGLDENYILPALISLLNAGTKYMKIRNMKLIKFVLNLL